MPDLLQSLQKYDRGHLRIVAGLWGLELDAKSVDAATEELRAAFLDPSLLTETLDVLPADARCAFEALTTRGGRIPWAEFTRQFGEIREMGPGKRDREQPHFNPASPAEALFYRALLARAFFNTTNGPLEFAYIPDDLLELVRHRKNNKASVDTVRFEVNPDPLGRPALPVEKAHPILANDAILDDVATLLASLRIGITPPETDLPIPVLEGFLRAAKIILQSGPEPEAIKAFLEAPRADALRVLTNAWLESETFNELRQLPGLVLEGEWKNQPLDTRKFLLALLDVVPKGKWWSLQAFIRDVKTRYPDFQRPAGDYDSWFIKRESDGEYLRGFAYWDQIDGALIRYLITGPLFWLGRVELAEAEEGTVTSFRLSSFDARKEEKGKIIVSSNGHITVERSAPRAVRYQIARFCEWEDRKVDQYRYRISPVALKRAGQQGLKVEYLLSLLAKHAAAGIPPVLVEALRRWEVNGTEARVQKQVVLRVSRPEVLEKMRKSKAARFLGEVLGPTAVTIKDGTQPKVLAALAELGVLAEEEK